MEAAQQFTQTDTHVELRDLFDVEKLHKLAWQPFKEGVEQFPLYNECAPSLRFVLYSEAFSECGASARLLRYTSNAAVPEHKHTGYEHIIVLSGSQRDHLGEITPGMLRINKPGSSHAVQSGQGCIVLVIYERPVQFTAV